MKKSAVKNQITKCIGVLILMVIATSAFAQNNVIKFTPFKQVFGKTSFNYERALKNNSSISFEYQHWNLTKRINSNNVLASLSFPLLSALTNSTSTYTNQGNRLQLEYRKYFSKSIKPGDGFYFTGGVFTGQHKTTRTSSDLGIFSIFSSKKREVYSSSVNSSGAKVGVGIQKKWGAFVLDWNTRIGGAKTNKGSNVEQPAVMNGLFVESNLAIGITF